MTGSPFLLVLRGQVMFTTFGEASVLDSNSLAVINHRELYSVECRGQNMVLLLRVSGEYLSTRCPEILKNRYTCSSVRAQSGTESLYESLKQSVARMAFVYLKQGEEDRLLFQSELMVVLHTLLHHFISGETYEMGRSPGMGSCILSFPILIRIIGVRSRWNSLQPGHTCRCRICPNCSERKQGFLIWNI